MELTILCKVIDNFGDIGVAWRMAKRFVELTKKDNPVKIEKVNLIVDGIFSFKKIENSIDNTQKYQSVNDVCVYDWNDYDFCYQLFSQNDGNKLSFIIECFQCGRPDWMEKILFEDKLQRTVHILMIDYLTAEKYAEDFHKLMSLTRSAKVQKVNFMPGFSNKTGGLIIEDKWKRIPKRNPDGPVLFFTYPKKWDGVAESFVKKTNKQILAANGIGFESVKNSFEIFLSKPDFSSRFKNMDFCNQSEWDNLLLNCSFLFIRGEDSLSRACLSGIPFVWHAYVQSEDYQLVKVKALLEIMRKYFKKNQFEVIENLWLLINQSDFQTNQNIDFEEKNQKIKQLCDSFIERGDDLAVGYRKFAQDLRKNGDLCQNIMTFIRKKYIIE